MKLRRATLGPLCLLLPLAAGAVTTALPAPAHAATPCTDSVPYRAGASGYHTFRIPALVATPGGTLLAFAEGRRNSAADDGDIDLVLRRSADGGCTWGPLQVVADAGGDTVGNPAPVVDPASGDVVLVSCGTVGGATESAIRNGSAAASLRRVYVQRSADGGATWSARRDITAQTKRADWRWYATGPGHAVALRHGRYRGRLLVPANHSVATGRRDGGHGLYSDDGGRTWHIGYVDDALGTVNESTLAELPDGRVYVNARDQGADARGSRDDAYSDDGGETLSVPFAPQPGLVGPEVQGSLLGPSPLTGGRLLFSGPADPDKRQRMQLRASADEGRTWRPVWTVSPAPAGYSDLAQSGPRQVGLLYETGTASSSESIRFVKVPPLVGAPEPAAP
jgi:sialidase-1